MPTENLSLGAYIVLWGGVCAALWTLFDKLESTASPAARTKLSNWLRRAPPVASATRLPEMFVEGFDRVFGPQPIRLQFFLRSCLASAVALTITLLSWIALRPDEVFKVAHAFPEANRSLFELALGAVLWFLGVLAINALPDYLSVIKSRAFVSAAARSTSLRKTTAILALDFLLCALLGIVAVHLYSFANVLTFIALSKLNSVDTGVSPFWYFSLMLPLGNIDTQHLWNVLALQGDTGISVEHSAIGIDFETKKTVVVGRVGTFSNMPIGINFYATFFTLFWVGSFVGSSVLVRIFIAARQVGKRLIWVLDVHKKPFQSLGVMTVVWLSAGFLTGLVLLVLTRL